MGYLLSKKALRTVHFKGKFDHNSSLFSETNMIKFSEKIPIENCLFVSKPLNNQFPEIFNNWFVFSQDTHRYETSWSKKCMLKVKFLNAKLYGGEAVMCSHKTFKNN